MVYLDGLGCLSLCWQLWRIRIAWCFHAWRIRWTGLSQNSNGFLHVSLSLGICLEAMWCIWMAWGVCPCAAALVNQNCMLGALGGQVLVFSMFLCLSGVFGWLGVFVPVLAALVNQNCMVFPCLVHLVDRFESEFQWFSPLV